MNISRNKRRGCKSKRSNRTKRSNNNTQYGGGVNITIKWGKQAFENLPVDLSAPVVKLRDYLSKLSRVPADKLKLVIGGKMLKDDESLELSGLKDGSVLTMYGTATTPGVKVDMRYYHDSKSPNSGSAHGSNISNRSNRPKKSLRRLFRSNRSLRPKFKSSMPAPARAHSAPTGVQKSTNSFYDDYTIFTYDNSPECRAMIGLDHPMLANVTVNDYMHASCRINDDLVNNFSNPIEEKREQMKISQKFFANVYHALPNGLDNSRAKTTPSKGQRQTLKPNVTSMAPQQNIMNMKSIGVGVSGRAGVIATGGGTPAPAPIEYTDSEQILDLKTILTYDKVKKFIALANKNSNPKLGWTRRAELFIKYMFLDTDIFDVRANGIGVLTGSMASGKKVTDSKFPISSVSYRKHVDSTKTSIVSTGPPVRIKVEGLDRNWGSQNLNSETIMPTLNSDMHTEAAPTEYMNISKILGRYKHMSPIESKHFIFSIILFVLKNLNDEELTEVILSVYGKAETDDLPVWDEQSDRTDKNEKVRMEFKRIHGLFRAVIPDDKLPYSAFFTTFTNNTRLFTGHVQMTRPFDPESLKSRTVAVLDRAGASLITAALQTIGKKITKKITMRGEAGDVVRDVTTPPEYDTYRNFIEFIYRRIMNGFDDSREFDFTIDPVGDPRAKRLEITAIKVKGGFEDIGIFYEMKNQDIISFTPKVETIEGVDVAVPGKGIITGKCNPIDKGVLDPDAAFFYKEEGRKNESDLQFARLQLARVTTPQKLNAKIEQSDGLSDDITTITNFEDKKNFFANRLVHDSIPYVLKNDFKTVDVSNMWLTDKSLTHWVFQTKSRIEGKLDKLMGHLSNLVYQPNDVIADVNLRYLEKIDTFSKNKFVYVGAFDPDPSYPIAFTEGSSEPPKISYSRVHVWLKTYSTKKDHELYIIVRGSKSGYDWESCDLDIIMGVLQNERSLLMPVILCNIIDYMNSCLTLTPGTDDDRSKKIAKALRNGGNHKAIQMFSSGHSLGGFLAMSMAHTILAKHLTNGISFSHITGVSRSIEKDRLYLKPYIIPIVFDPYLGMGSAVHNAFAFLPYVRIHSCIDTVAIVKEPTSGTDLVSQEPNFRRKWDFLNPIVQTLDNIQNKIGRYDDVASRYFLAYIQNMYSDTRYNTKMGQFITFHYRNVYNHFADPKIYYRTADDIDRVANDMRIGHDLLQMVGLSAQYVFFNTPTKFYVETGLPSPFDKQSIQSMRYNFPIPQNISVAPEYTITTTEVESFPYPIVNVISELELGLSVLTEDRHVRANVMKSDFTTIGSYTLDGEAGDFINFEIKERSKWLKVCQSELIKEMNDFTSSMGDE